MTNPTTDFALKNNTDSSEAFAYITGLDLNRDNTPVFIQADGKTTYHPASPAEPQSPLQADVAIPLGAPGTTTRVTIPHIAGGRVWFSVGARLNFLLNPGPAVVEPSVTNPSDPSYGVAWGFCEFTYNQQQLFVNISYVDFVPPHPIALELRNTDGATQTVRGMGRGGLAAVCDELARQGAADGAGWEQLVVRGADGAALRALSPNSGRVLRPGLFDGYFDAYVDAVWERYRGADLTINTQAAWGDVAGRVAADGLLTFAGAGAFAKPSAGDIFSCSTGPFGNYPPAQREQMGALGARLAAAFNRSTLLANDRQPDGERVAAYYAASPTNHYARIVHAANLDGRGYAFPYDDVVPSGGTAGPDQAGTVFDGSPELLTITLGGPADGDNGGGNGGDGGSGGGNGGDSGNGGGNGGDGGSGGGNGGNGGNGGDGGNGGTPDKGDGGDGGDDETPGCLDGLKSLFEKLRQLLKL
ncbi:glycoside hydrolase family 64 protein [Durotheca rogersii]|uniref:glycoside hydrolase family 64 protein n=1 Tax=Durotheca rogersii TaxID=419775 RepID=UPI00221FE976|nr:glycoside hydrolase family 64 protein [Durotheca rogersii]KAI5863212.1 glycoside hydrolase family 64 protein [Durotheca rogersii]